VDALVPYFFWKLGLHMLGSLLAPTVTLDVPGEDDPSLFTLLGIALEFFDWYWLVEARYAADL